MRTSTWTVSKAHDGSGFADFAQILVATPYSRRHRPLPARNRRPPPRLLAILSPNLFENTLIVWTPQMSIPNNYLAGANTELTLL
jgi:hypothetical protein